jgi:hypothetical protein
MEAVIYRRDRKFPIVIREYLDEVYVPPRTGTNNNTGSSYEVTGPWQTHTKRMLRHKCMIQGFRVAFGFAGIYDEDEAGRILDATKTETGYVVADEPNKPTTLADKVADIAARRTASDAPAEPQKEPDNTTGPGVTPAA